MITKRILVSIAAVVVSVTGAAVMADSGKGHMKKETAVKEMAEIVTNLEHYPSDSEKQTLKHISESNDVPKQQQVIATAIMNMKHSPTDSDKEKLKQIMNDPEASAQERELASIMYGINHKPSAADKAKLQAMLE